MYLKTVVTTTVLICLVGVSPSAGFPSFITFLNYVFERYPLGVTQPDWPPDFCNDLNCPQYTLLDKNEEQNYEVRRYDETRWASTSLTGNDYHSVFHAMFMKLYEYIGGDNDDHAKLEMTSPVLSRVMPCTGRGCSTEFTMSFYMHQDRPTRFPPTPRDPHVTITSLPEMMVYVSHFDGFASQSDFVERFDWLSSVMPQDRPVNSTYYYAVTYDAPSKQTNRHNEVWLVAIPN